MKVTVQVLLEEETLAQVDSMAEEKGLSRSAVVRLLVLDGLAR